MELPANLLLKAIKGGRAYASVNSEVHGPYIIVYSIIWGALAHHGEGG